MPTTTLPLKDIHLPAAISWWPPAIGWWLVAILLPITLGLLYWLYKRLTRKTALKAAKKHLLAIKHNTALDNRQKLSELSMLLRRVAISLHPRADVASLTGTCWLAFLDQSLNATPFSTGAGRLFLDAPYRNTTLSEQDLAQLITVCENWLQAQHKQPKSKSHS